MEIFKWWDINNERCFDATSFCSTWQTHFPQKECRTVILSVKRSGTAEGSQTMQCHPERVEGSHKREEVHIKRKMFRRRCALLNMTNAFPQKECRTVILSVKQSGTAEGPQTLHCHPEREAKRNSRRTSNNALSSWAWSEAEQPKDLKQCTVILSVKRSGTAEGPQTMHCHPERVEGTHKREEVHIKPKMFRRRCALPNMTNAFPQKECRTVILSVKRSGTAEGPQTLHCHPERVEESLQKRRGSLKRDVSTPLRSAQHDKPPSMKAYPVSSWAWSKAEQPKDLKHCTVILSVKRSGTAEGPQTMHCHPERVEGSRFKKGVEEYK